LVAASISRAFTIPEGSHALPPLAAQALKSSWAVTVLGSLMPSALAFWSASFADRLDRQGHDDLVRHLAGLTVAHAPHEVDVLPHELEEGFHVVERLLRSAQHDRERSGLGSPFTPGDGCVRVVGLRLAHRSANPFVAVGEIELMSTTTLPADSPSTAPPSPKSTSPTSGVSGTMMMITSELSATSLEVAHSLAPPSKSSWGTGLMSRTASEYPAPYR
jgi:hypothetical protein